MIKIIRPTDWIRRTREAADNLPRHRRPDRPADLGPNQIAWLKANVHGFAKKKEQADAAAEHAAQVRAQIENGR